MNELGLDFLERCIILLLSTTVPDGPVKGLPLHEVLQRRLDIAEAARPQLRGGPCPKETTFEVTESDNELLRIWARYGLWTCDGTYQSWMHRNLAIADYSWAVPTKETLEAFVAHSGGKIVEFGCGTGYWARLLRDAGADVIAGDDTSESPRHLHINNIIENDGAEYLRSSGGCPDRMLFLCWPRYEDGDEWLNEFKGNKLAVIGEGPDMCTWCLEEENTDWKLDKWVHMPNWPGIHDFLSLYTRQNNIEA